MLFFISFLIYSYLYDRKHVHDVQKNKENTDTKRVYPHYLRYFYLLSYSLTQYKSIMMMIIIMIVVVIVLIVDNNKNTVNTVKTAGNTKTAPNNSPKPPVHQANAPHVDSRFNLYALRSNL